MASLIPGFEYDIFISYRQKDNKYDGWVTEFVDNLKKELEATFKEEISVYFDINPHDGLLETHDVDESLKEKLKCLIFIPIISRTYCDSKSFAWEHEFKAFVELASKDRFGLKVKLPNGNVASRVLPVRIYDLDSTDIKLCESLLGGMFRGVDFIYKSAGVNRPLRSREEKPQENLNNGLYRDQINKVANSIKEIISGLKTEPIELGKEKVHHRELSEEVKKEERKVEKGKSTKIPKRRLLSGITILVVLIFAAVIGYPKIFKRDTLEKLRSSGERISIAVMPFQNMTADTSLNFWQDGIQDNLITNLSNYSEELIVKQIESIKIIIQSKGFTNKAAFTPAVAREISQKLDANIFIYGGLKPDGSAIRLSAQLIDSKTETVFKSFQITGPTEEILHNSDSLSLMVRDFLILSKLKKEEALDFQKAVSTNSPEAYRYFILGKNAFGKDDWPSAIDYLKQAIKLDSNLYYAYIFLAGTYERRGMHEESKKWCLKLYNKRDMMTPQEKLMWNIMYADYFETLNESIKYVRQYLEIDDQSPFSYYLLGLCYNDSYQYDKAIPEFEKAFKIYKKWGSKPYRDMDYYQLGIAYHKTGKFRKEKQLYRNAEQDFPNIPRIIQRQTILALIQGDTKDANEYIEKYISIQKENSATEATMATNLANIYDQAEILDKSEEYYRKALSLEPNSFRRMNTLAYFLIDKDRNLAEGMEIIDKVLESILENYNYLHTKGWGLYKQGRYQEAKEILQKSWDLRREKAVYDHEAYLHLEAAKKAVADQKLHAFVVLILI